ncbi:MAG: type II secretion system major pseudopilin GspG [Sedimentisphaerales bacterium]|nr:type II secretion system major pseudopilin GspG [Sedimentisphaerales bacterium]
MRRKNETKRKGFTLVELLVVIVILAMLSGIVAPKFFAQIEKARWDSCRSKMAPIESSIETFLLNTNYYPGTLNELVEDPGLNGWAGPYLKASQLLDPWDNPYIYNPYSGGYELISYGADGVQGGTLYDEDIYND